ncbi:MAG: hypothetical protein M1819_003119 [Sarea resinae]|nr:MAG: hypothetical protein M1819_003119 [Sarea resinae]
MIALRRERVSFNRKADTRIGLLKEVIERVQGGEEVNVEGLLGTGDKAKEKEWEDVLRELEAEDALWQSRSGAKKGRTVVQDATTEPAEARAMESASRGGEDQGRQIQSAAPGRNTDATAPREKRPLREYF